VALARHPQIGWRADNRVGAVAGVLRVGLLGQTGPGGGRGIVGPARWENARVRPCKGPLRSQGNRPAAANIGPLGAPSLRWPPRHSFDAQLAEAKVSTMMPIHPFLRTKRKRVPDNLGHCKAPFSMMPGNHRCVRAGRRHVRGNTPQT